ncbi:MAG: hypothetical protein UT60_C0017G0002 [candidate division CPR2 bacterium GW2011_GWD2_39_7]|nr:MAG: hypothetical protein UT60_C0017G0002 [candidate division CPR2 bacterium GW2011_GWD2_39_7]
MTYESDNFIFQIGNIRNQQVHSRHTLIGEADAAVNKQDLSLSFVGEHVSGDISHSAQRDNFQHDI